MVVDGSITNSPVFDRGFSPMFDRDAETSDVSLALGKYVPAVSRPMGGNGISLLSNNIDMNLGSEMGGVPRPNEWGRMSGDDDDTAPWKHSDMKDMAFFYVFKLYEQLIQKGNLK